MVAVMRARPTAIPYVLAFFPSLRSASDRTVSVYFEVRPDAYNSRFYDIQFKRLLDQHLHKLDRDDRELVQQEISHIKAELDILRPAGCPCMAGYSDSTKKVVRLIRLPEVVEARLEVGPPLLAPLDLLLRKRPPALIVVVHKTQAQTFASILDEVIPQHKVEGSPVKHIKSGGNRNPNLQRQEENRVKANMAQVVRIIDREVSAVNYKRLYLAGPDEPRSELEKLLPPSLKKIVAGYLSASLDLSVGELEVGLRAQLRSA